MARALSRLGVRRLYATPHQFRFGCRWTQAEIDARVVGLGGDHRRAGITLDIVASAEHMYGEELVGRVERNEPMMTFEVPDAAERDRDRVALLVELPLRQPAIGVERLAERLRGRGILPIMAHPERVAAAVDRPDCIERWTAAGWTFQLDLLSLAGSYGRAPGMLARRLLAGGRYRWAGSDLHRSSQLADLEVAHAECRRIPGQASSSASANAVPGPHEMESRDRHD